MILIDDLNFIIIQPWILKVCLTLSLNPVTLSNTRQFYWSKESLWVGKAGLQLGLYLPNLSSLTLSILARPKPAPLLFYSV